ncbi:MAG: riboflavin biosynthesis protein RibF [Bacteroidia bacterium]|nr:riboflavin biosynthesis protein RibF [Bacteroidia bacterium]MDW8088342.1 riboflavin kinase [Bacteroidia bacterium]
MQSSLSATPLPEATHTTGPILTLGTFDGVHMGHEHLLAAAREWAQAEGTGVEVWVFHPHPRAILQGESPPLLTTLEERLFLLRAQAERVRVIPFTPELAKLSAEAFLTEWIQKQASPRGIIVGYDHRFGRGREGSADFLRQRGIPVRQVPPYRAEGEIVSSSRIRKALAAGAVAEAQRLLGYPYTVRGLVQPGRGIARTLGTPTANLAFPPEKIRPPAGTYAGYASLSPLPLPLREGEAALLYLSPEGVLEVHFLHGTSQPLYGALLAAAFLHFLRPFTPIDSPAVLKAQIQTDLEAAHRFFQQKS